MNLTKTERRILAAETSTKPIINLRPHLVLRKALELGRTGSKACACGARISANKLRCQNCDANAC